MKTIFLNAGGVTSFKKWFIVHRQSSNDDDQPGGATPMAIAVPALDEPINALSSGQPHRPWLAWLVPRGGVGTLRSVPSRQAGQREPHRREVAPDDELSRTRIYVSHRGWNFRCRSACNQAECGLQTWSRLAPCTPASGSTASILRSECDSDPLRMMSARERPAGAQQADFANVPIAVNIASRARTD
jgi:hypothetical protein